MVSELSENMLDSESVGESTSGSSCIGIAYAKGSLTLPESNSDGIPLSILEFVQIVFMEEGSNNDGIVDEGVNKSHMEADLHL